MKLGGTTQWQSMPYGVLLVATHESNCDALTTL